VVSHHRVEPSLRRARTPSALRSARIALGLLVTLVAGAILFYATVEHYTLADAIYMAVITLSTVGFMEPQPLSHLGRLFTAGFILSGILLAWWLARSGAELIFREGLLDVWSRRRRFKMLDRLKDHYIVCGYGRMGREIIAQFQRAQVPAVVVERATEPLRLLQEQGIPFVEGNATDDQVLLTAGIERAKGLIAVTSTDEDNLFITLSARVLNPGLFIVVRCASEEVITKFERAGASRVVSPYEIGARSIATAVLRPAVSEFLDQILHREDVDVDMQSVTIGPGSPLAGSTLADLALRRHCGASVVAILGPDGRYHTNPDADYVVQEGDQFIVMGTPYQLRRLEGLTRGQPSE